MATTSGDYQHDEDQDQENIDVIPLTIEAGPSKIMASIRKRKYLAVLLVTLTVLGFLGPLNFFMNNDDTSSGTTNSNDHHTGTVVSSVDVNAPPVQLSEEDVARLQQEREEQASQQKPEATPTQVSITEALSHSDGGKHPELPFPIVDASDEVIPKTAIAVRAADALECRESVIAFVINATDAKDECEGLKRAFDKTCNGDSQEESKPSTDSQATVPPIQGRRKLFESSGAPDWKVFSYRLSKSLHRVVRTLIGAPANDGMLFVDELVAGDAYEEARYQVQNGLDRVVLDKVRRRLEAGRAQRRQEEEEELIHVEPPRPLPQEDVDIADVRAIETTQPPRPVEQEGIDAVDVGTIETTEHPTKEVVKEKPKTSLTLPTSSQHVSGQVLAETLMLQKESDVLAASAKANANQTNVTLSDAQTDAAASSKAVSDTANVVSALLNDPDSVEARVCCASILNVFHENCDAPEEETISDRKLIMIVVIIAFCGMIKSLIRHYQIRWLPEAAGCIVVGVLFGAVCSFIPHYDFSFDGDWFLRIMVPPIVFEAALSIDKKSFNRHVIPILFYAIAGTLMATVITAFIVHRGTVALGGWCETIPYVESLTFGALISSIDPIAVLSVLSNMGMTDTDTIYVVIFGESLLNDGVAIVLFQTLVHFLDESLVIDSEALTAATIHFFVIALGSLSVGVVSGIICTVYYWAFHGCQTPLVEVLMFFCWAFIPYYVCDGIGWSGIVSVVTTGFVMDLYVVGQQMSDSSSSHDEQVISNVTHKRAMPSFWKRAFSKQGHLSAVARTHVGFVTEILATMMETAIFAYLGFFLFSYRYHWNVWHTLIAIFACCMSRGIMIPSLSFVANWTTHLQQIRNNCRSQSAMRRNPAQPGVMIEPKMQLILWFAGLRGAMSFALVENIPLYDTVTGEGSRLKPEMKAMTSASIVFTVFILGGYTFYMIERLGMAPNRTKQAQSLELASLIPSLSVTKEQGNSSGDDEQDDDEDQSSYESSTRRDAPMFRRQRKSDIAGTLPSSSTTNSAIDHSPTIRNMIES